MDKNEDEESSLTGSIDTRGSYPGIVFASAQDLVQHLLLLLSEVDVCIVGSAGKWTRRGRHDRGLEGHTGSEGGGTHSEALQRQAK